MTVQLGPIVEEVDRIERHKMHLDRYLKNQLVKNVLFNETTFRREVENFYDIQMQTNERIFGDTYSLHLKEEHPEKIGQCPEELVEILQEFNKNPFNKSILRYETVRRFARKNNKLQEYLRLYDTAERADNFMDRHYRNHFVKYVFAREK